MCDDADVKETKVGVEQKKWNTRGEIVCGCGWEPTATVGAIIEMRTDGP